MRILGVFKRFSPPHPLWSPFVEWQYRHVVKHLNAIDVQDPFPLVSFEPDVIISDVLFIGLGVVRACPTIFFLSDADAAECLHEADGVFSWSATDAVNLREATGVTPKVITPVYLNKPAEPKFIIYDDGHPDAECIQRSLPKEQFRTYDETDELKEAKLFLPWPNDRFDGRVCLALSRGVPVVTSPSEWMPPACVTVTGGTWPSAVKNVVRDRAYWSSKATAYADRYKNIGYLEDQVGRIVKQRMTRTEIRDVCVEVQAASEPQPQKFRKQVAAPSLPAASDSIFLTGGIGDVLALESFIPDHQRRNLRTICYGTNKRVPIETLFKSITNYPQLTNHVVVWDDFRSFWCFISKEDCERRLPADQRPADFIASEDWGIIQKFPLIKTGKLKYNQSSFLTNKLADVTRFGLPVKYHVICPYSTDKRLAGRDFSDEDWAAAIYHLIKHKLTGVVLNTGNDAVPNNSCVIDLSNQTTIAEAVEVLKGAEGYIGIDSSLSVLAAKLFNYPRLMIKSQNDHCYSNKTVYYAPQRTFEFLGTSIQKLVPKGLL